MFKMVHYKRRHTWHMSRLLPLTSTLISNHRSPFVRLPFTSGLPACVPCPWAIPWVEDRPKGSSCSTMALVGNEMPVRCECLGTISMKSDSLIQKTLRLRNFGFVSLSRSTASFQPRNGDATATDIELRSCRQREPTWLGVAVRRAHAVSTQRLG